MRSSPAVSRESWFWSVRGRTSGKRRTIAPQEEPEATLTKAETRKQMGGRMASGMASAMRLAM
eukprot:2971018-Rhodomonas_salina.3